MHAFIFKSKIESINSLVSSPKDYNGWAFCWKKLMKKSIQVTCVGGKEQKHDSAAAMCQGCYYSEAEISIICKVPIL